MPLIATRGAASAQGFGEFAQAAAPVYIEDVFSTYLYTGNGSTQTITNNIDISGKGGLVWIKERSEARSHALFDTARGATIRLYSDSTVGNQTEATTLTAFNTNGFSVSTSLAVNSSSQTYTSWTFREQPKFFDVVTYTGNGSAPRAISHNLASTPGCIIIKRTDSTGDWWVFHRSAPNQGVAYPGIGGNLYLNYTDVADSGANPFLSAVSSTTFTLSTNQNATMNINGATYVAYLFAHDAGGFGLTGSDNVITCGSFTTNGSGNASINLGYEPQWIMRKGSTILSNWEIYDIMRGITAASASQSANYLLANTDGAEGSSPQISINSTGFAITSGASSQTYIYIAIRRGPMKTPTDTTKVFDVNLFNYGSISLPYKSTSGFVTDLSIDKGYAGTYAVSDWQWQERLVGSASILRSNSTSSESTNGNLTFDYNNGVSFNNSISVASGSDNVHYQFSRAPGFFDVVCTTGDGSGNLSFTHNLGVTPEFIIIKARTGTFNWYVYCSHLSDPTKTYGTFTTASLSPSSSTFWSVTSSTVTTYQGGWVANNGAGVVFLFATCPGISKVGSYTGTGTTNQINCGFTGGSRLVIIKRTDSTGSWYVYDNSRGIIGGNDPYLQLDSSAGEITGTDYIDSYNPGFEISSTAPAGLNANGGTYIFLAISN